MRVGQAEGSQFTLRRLVGNHHTIRRLGRLDATMPWRDNSPALSLAGIQSSRQ